MPDFIVRTINSSFFTEAELPDLSDSNAALEAGVRGAIMIAADEINGGASAAVIEVIVEDATGQQVRRSAVSISHATLATDRVEQREPPEQVNDR